MPVELMPFNYPVLGYIRGGVGAWQRAGSPAAFWTCCGCTDKHSQTCPREAVAGNVIPRYVTSAGPLVELGLVHTVPYGYIEPMAAPAWYIVSQYGPFMRMLVPNDTL